MSVPEKPKHMCELPEELIRVLGLLYVHAAINAQAGDASVDWFIPYVRELAVQLIDGVHRAKETDALYAALRAQDSKSVVREVKRLADKALNLAASGA